jgi:parallel beta-helix repeat protein
MTQDENWCRDVLITGSVQIAPGVTLTIQPGVTIRFKEESDNQYNNREFSTKVPPPSQTPSIIIDVFGTLYAHGTSTEPIVFTSGHDVAGPRDWDSIAIEEDGMVSLDHVVLEHGHFGLQVNTPTSQATISHSTIRHVTTTGIATGDHPIDGPIIVSNSRFLDCGREAIDTYPDQNIIVRHNIFSDNYVAIMSVGSSIIIESNLFTSNIRGIGVVESGNPTIIGNEFTNNDGAAIFVTDASPLITYNNLYTNVLNLELNASTLGVTAENNWWGSSDDNTIAASILDGVDDPALGFVDFEPYAIDPFDLDVPE